MKKIYYLVLGLALIGCENPSSFTTLKINTTDIVTQESIDGINCNLFEDNDQIIQKQTIHGETVIAFDAHDRRSYSLSVESGDYLLINQPNLGIQRGQNNVYNVELAQNSVLDFGLQALVPMSTVTDKLEYQIRANDYWDVPTISNGWVYNEPDLFGEIHNDHYAMYDLPTGYYTLDWRTTISGTVVNGTEAITVSGDTTHFVFSY